LFSG